METDAGVESHDFPKCSSAFSAAKKRHPDWDLGFTLAPFGPVEPRSLLPSQTRIYDSTPRALPAVLYAPPSFPDGKFMFAQ